MLQPETFAKNDKAALCQNENNCTVATTKKINQQNLVYSLLLDVLTLYNNLEKINIINTSIFDQV